MFSQLVESQLEDVHKVMSLFEEDKANIVRGLGGDVLSAYQSTIEIALTQMRDIDNKLRALQGNG